MSGDHKTIDGFQCVKSGPLGDNSVSYTNFLREKYKTIDILNQECMTNYKSFEEFSQDSIAAEEQEPNNIPNKCIAQEGVQEGCSPSEYKSWRKLMDTTPGGILSDKMDNNFHTREKADFGLTRRVESTDGTSQTSSNWKQELYVIIHNSKSICYLESLQKARQRMRSMAIRRKYYHKDHNCSIIVSFTKRSKRGRELQELPRVI